MGLENLSPPLRTAISFGRQGKMTEAFQHLMQWLGVSHAGLYRPEGDCWSCWIAYGNPPLTLASPEMGEQETIKLFPSSEAEEQRGVVRIQPSEGSLGYLLWVALPPATSLPASFLCGLLELIGEVLANWLRPKEVAYDIEPLARSFRVATLGELAAGIAHEINNPLQVIMGNAELLLDTAELNERVREKLTDILQAAESIRNIARAVTHFADVRRSEEKELLDLNQVVRDAMQLVSYSLVRNGIQLILQLAPDLSPIWARRGDLEEIIVQLVRNASEAIMESGKGSQVIVRTQGQGEWVRLEVEDDGPGVPPNLRDRIFDPFVTTKAAKGGTGLGLAIIQNLLAAHRGRIRLEDSPSGGARFVVEFPSWESAFSQPPGERSQ